MVIHNLFSYGTLQQENVQLETYKRKLAGSPDILTGYRLHNLEIKDAAVIATSGKSVHPVAIYTGETNDRINGVIFEITEEELMATDTYEVADYKRVSAIFQSGRQAWIYVAK